MKPRLRERAARRLKFWAERIEAGAVPGKIIEFEPVDHAKGTKAFNHYRKLEMEISRVHGSEAKIEALKAELDRAREDFLEATTRRE
ncbi:MAG TPA: hypothetical protein VJI67_03680, partial [archaeon]|nr:hypothetical protein [archaeon]